MSLATILLPNFNNERVLPVTFDYLRKYVDCSKFDLVVIDDGSEDQGLHVAKIHAADCKFKRMEIIERPHEGIVAALNAGLDAVRTDIVIRIDGDATVETPNWPNLLLKPLEFDEVGLVGGHVIWESGRVHSLGRSAFSPLGLYDMGCCPLEPIGSRTFDSIVYRPLQEFSSNHIYEVDTVLGVCVAFRKSDAMAFGGFDMMFNPVWIEDDDFGVAIRNLGKRVLVDPRIHVTHRPSLRGCREPGKVKAALSGGRVSGNLKQRIFQKFRTMAAKSKSVLFDARSAPQFEDILPREQDPWRVDILKSHYAKWHSKWGFDPLNPAMLQFARRYWETALCWSMNPTLLERSCRFLAGLN